MNDFLIYYDGKPVALIECFTYDKEKRTEKLLVTYDKIIRFNEELSVNGFCKLPAEAMISVSGSSKGTQTKYFYENVWYKQNRIGYEGLAEELASRVLCCSNVNDYVSYTQCIINDKKGCSSKNFLKKNESYTSLQRFYNIYYERELLDTIRGIENIRDRIQYVVDFIREATGMEIKEYLGKMLTFDMLILNTDRHFNNIGLITNGVTKQYKMAPFFDHGNSLLSNIAEFPFDDSIEENIEKVIGQPFSANLERQAMELGFGLKVNYKKLYKLLEKEPDSRALEVLKYQLRRYEKIIRDDNL